MTDAAIEAGEKVLIITRRNFAGDLSRHFAGTVLAASNGLARLQGYAFVLSNGAQEYVRKPELRTRIFAISDAQLIIICLPQTVVVENLKYQKHSYDGSLILTDGSAFKLDLKEFGGEY